MKSTLDSLLHAAHIAGSDKMPALVLADHLEERGIPGAHIVREAAGDAHGYRLWQNPENEDDWGFVNDHTADDMRNLYHATDGKSWEVFVDKHPEKGTRVMVRHMGDRNAPDDFSLPWYGVTHEVKVRSAAHLKHLLSDFPKKKPGEKIHLARVKASRVNEDFQQYRQGVRKNVHPDHWNTPLEHKLMVEYLKRRGLTIHEAVENSYDPKEHALYTVTPHDPSAIVHQYVRHAERPVKLARGDSAEKAFQSRMESHPHDHDNKLIYADWLDDHDAHDAATKLRWITRAEAESRSPDLPESTDPETFHALPEWARRLVAIRRAREAVKHVKPYVGFHKNLLDRALETLNHAERGYLGLQHDLPASIEIAGRLERVSREHNVPERIREPILAAWHAIAKDPALGLSWAHQTLHKPSLDDNRHPHERYNEARDPAVQGAVYHAQKEEPVKLARNDALGNAWWLDPEGNFHPVDYGTHREWMAREHGSAPGVDPLSHGFNNGWMRIVHFGRFYTAENPKMQANAKQLQAIKDHAMGRKAHEVEVYGPKGMPKQQVRLARRKKPATTDEIAFLAHQIAQSKRRSLAIKSLIRNKADTAEAIHNAYRDNPLTDDTARLVFADWLADRMDPREVIVRQHVPWAYNPTAPEHVNSYTAHRHPEAPDALSYAPINSGGPAGPKARSALFGSYDFSNDLIHPSVSEEQYQVEEQNGALANRYRQRPALVWRHFSRERYGSYPGAGSYHPVVFYAPVTWDQYHEYARTLPPEKQKEWETYAQNHYTEGRAGRKPPTKLERMRYPGQGAATRAAQTDTHQTRMKVVQSILREAGVPAVVKSVLTHSGAGGVRPTVAAVSNQPLNPALARYLGGWLGLMTGEQHYTAFVPGEGEDTLHIIESPHPAEHVTEYLRRAGVPAFSVESRGDSSRIFIANPMDTMDVEGLASGLHATNHTRLQGSADRLGPGRDHFRQVIRDAESQQEPAKLARISDEPGVIVKVPVPTPVQQKPAAPPAPPKPQPTFFLPF